MFCAFTLWGNNKLASVASTNIFLHYMYLLLKSFPSLCSSTFGIMSSINFCPPKPGSTVITSAMSIWLAHGASSSTVVPGLMATPTWRRGTEKATETALINQANQWPNVTLVMWIVIVSLIIWEAQSASRPHLHAALSDLLDQAAGVLRGLQVKGVLVGSCCRHGLHPALRLRHHHVHVCSVRQCHTVVVLKQCILV